MSVARGVALLLVEERLAHTHTHKSLEAADNTGTHTHTLLVIFYLDILSVRQGSRSQNGSGGKKTESERSGGVDKWTVLERERKFEEEWRERHVTDCLPRFCVSGERPFLFRRQQRSTE